MRRLATVVFSAIVLALMAQQAIAARVALIIGNAAYRYTPPLTTPGNDAEAFSAFLRDNDFEVTTLVDGTRAEMSAALDGFVKELGPSDTAIFYFAGHGYQDEGENYLLGVEAQFANAYDIAAESLRLTQIQKALEGRAHLSMLFIDACRNNPLANRLPATERGLGVGLAAPTIETTSEGLMIAFAAAPNSVAQDGVGNSPFTKALIAHLAEPGLEVGTAFKRVIRDVRDETNQRQVPQIVSSVSVEFYFNVDQPQQPLAIIDDPPQPTLTVVVPQAPEPLPTTTVAALPRRTETPAREIAREDVALLLQQQLQLAGCDIGIIDGRWGPRSRRALVSYADAVGIGSGGGEPDALFLEIMASTVVGACAEELGPLHEIDPRGYTFEGAWTEEQTTRNSRGIESTHTTRHTYILDVARDGTIADTYIAGINDPRTTHLTGELGGAWVDSLGDTYSWYLENGRLVRQIERGTYTSRANFTVVRRGGELACTLEVLAQLKPGETRVMARTQAGNVSIELVDRHRIKTTCSIH